jgi:hypothetical protein
MTLKHFLIFPIVFKFLVLSFLVIIARNNSWQGQLFQTILAKNAASQQNPVRPAFNGIQNLILPQY